MTSLELQDRAAHRSTHLPTEPSSRQSIDEENPHNNVLFEQNLAPADEGAAAWRLLGAAFVFEALLWGTQILPLNRNLRYCEDIFQKD